MCVIHNIEVKERPDINYYIMESLEHHNIDFNIYVFAFLAFL